MQIKTLKFVKRKIRKTIQTLLMDKTEAKCNVFISRSTNIDDSELPCILIYPTNERVEIFNSAPKDYKRIHSCKIEIMATADTDDALDLLLETIAEKVEFLLHVNETDDKYFGKLIDSLAITGSQYTFAGEGQAPTGSLALDVDFIFYADTIPEGLDLPDFTGADFKWQHGHHNASPDTGDNLDADADGDDGAIKATDTINLPGV